AVDTVRKAMIDAPVTCAADAAAKFRLVARLVSNEDGMYAIESEAVAAAVDGLATWRAKEAEAMGL
ncbi:hypothetical protein AB4144_59170, partial [Rhizobiaceae sp. 2RAB30]